MKTYYFKTICTKGIAHTCQCFALNVKDAQLQAAEIFGAYYPGHGFINYMRKNDYFDFHKLKK